MITLEKLLQADNKDPKKFKYQEAWETVAKDIGSILEGRKISTEHNQDIKEFKQELAEMMAYTLIDAVKPQKKESGRISDQKNNRRNNQKDEQPSPALVRMCKHIINQFERGEKNWFQRMVSSYKDWKAGYNKDKLHSAPILAEAQNQALEVHNQNSHSDLRLSAAPKPETLLKQLKDIVKAAQEGLGITKKALIEVIENQLVDDLKQTADSKKKLTEDAKILTDATNQENIKKIFIGQKLEGLNETQQATLHSLYIDVSRKQPTQTTLNPLDHITKVIQIEKATKVGSTINTKTQFTENAEQKNQAIIEGVINSVQKQLGDDLKKVTAKENEMKEYATKLTDTIRKVDIKNIVNGDWLDSDDKKTSEEVKLMQAELRRISDKFLPKPTLAYEKYKLHTQGQKR
jgi:hypothetical protein